MPLPRTTLFLWGGDLFLNAAVQLCILKFYEIPLFPFLFMVKSLNSHERN